MSGKEKTEKNKRSNPDTMEIPNRLEKSVKLADGLTRFDGILDLTIVRNTMNVECLFQILWWREKVQDAPMSAGCAEMRKPRKIGGFIHFGKTVDEPNTFYFYFQYNRNDMKIVGVSGQARLKLFSREPAMKKYID